jgi:Tfp pilus assembly protein PilV
MNTGWQKRKAVGGGRGNSAGFSLIEVCMAILVIGLGLLAVFSLFPSGLRMAEEGAADTHCGLFTETVMKGLQGNAAGITNWATWSDPVGFEAALIAGVIPGTSTVTKVTTTCSFPEASAWASGDATKAYLRYQLDVDAASHSATLQVWDGQYGSLLFPQVKAYTEFSFKGM